MKIEQIDLQKQLIESKNKNDQINSVPNRNEKLGRSCEEKHLLKQIAVTALRNAFRAVSEEEKISKNQLKNNAVI
jgi:hypothetical protein